MAQLKEWLHINSRAQLLVSIDGVGHRRDVYAFQTSGSYWLQSIFIQVLKTILMYVITSPKWFMPHFCQTP